MLEKIIDILDKYKYDIWSQDIVESIDECCQEILILLRQNQNDLSDKLHTLTKSDHINDYTICDDILDDIKAITQLIKHFKELKQNLDIIKTRTKQSVLENKLIIYVIDDNLCPDCNVKLYPLCIDYQKIINGNIEDYDTIEGYECQCCKKLFAMQYEIDNIDFTDTNIILDYQYLKEENQLSFKDVIVLSNLISCTSKEHSLNDVMAQIPVFNADGSINFIRMNISYCGTCDKYIMLKNDFKQIDGVVACKVIDNTKTYNKNDKDEIEIKQHESVLYQYGYNVNMLNNLSDKQRHLILAAVVESGILTRDQICSHLDTLIERGNKIEKWKYATEKWKQDRNYVKKYNVNNLSNILIEKVILKYSQMSLF